MNEATSIVALFLSLDFFLSLGLSVIALANSTSIFNV